MVNFSLPSIDGYVIFLSNNWYNILFGLIFKSFWKTLIIQQEFIFDKKFCKNG